jgi:hypothetical protein
MSTAQLTIVNMDIFNTAPKTDSSPAGTSRYRLDDRTRQIGQAGLESARAVLAAAAARREAAQCDHAQAA